VVLSVTNGDVLAMASRPAFDPNLFAEGISKKTWQGLVKNSRAPLVNRAAAGAYPPGSLFKLVVAVAALEHGEGVSGSTVFQCPGYYDLGAAKLKCWNWQYGGHGPLDMRKAIEQSCNTYFCNLGVKTGYRTIRDMAFAFGLGRKTGLDLDMERGGNLPPVRSIRSRGDIANISIGQGAVDTTPLQMAVVVAAIANGGRIYRPRLLLGIRAGDEETFRELPPVLERNLGLAGSTLEVVRDGMFAVVNAQSGSGKRAKLDSVKVAGKTGSAQYGTADNPKTRGWMAVYFPFDNPRYVAVVMLDEAVSGGITVAPLIRGLAAKIMGVQTESAGT
jgi:penicillin-binding protein 2